MAEAVYIKCKSNLQKTTITFQISCRIGKAYIFNKNEGNNQKVENKWFGMVGLG